MKWSVIFLINVIVWQDINLFLSLMKLYTVQPKWIYEHLMKEGVFYFKSQVYEDPFLKDTHWTKAYDWLKEQMISKGIQKPDLAQDLGWAWYRWTEKNHAPNGNWIKSGLKHRNAYEEIDVRMEIDIADHRVLLSHYHAWHMVLNYSYLDYMHKMDEFEEKCNKIMSKEQYRQTPFPIEALDHDVKHSWQKIFDLSLSDTIINDGESNEQLPVQATFWHLTREDIIKAEAFSWKGKKELLYTSDK